MAKKIAPQFNIIDAPCEIILGDTMEFDVECTGPLSHYDWVGVYPISIPSLPGLSHGRWKYISSFADTKSESGKSLDDNSTKVIRVRLEPQVLPNHKGDFELRIHHSDLYGVTLARSAFRIIDGPVSIFRKIFFLALLIATVWSFQTFLNAKGICAFLDPVVHPHDVIDDLYIRWTTPINLWLIANPHYAEACQAISSLSLDGAILVLLWVGSTRRSSVRPFLSLFLFMFLRFLAQIMAVIPCAPGYTWPAGKLFGYTIPTIFVDYHPANDMYFSGHAGTTFVIGLEFMELDYYKMAWWQLGIVFPLISTWVVSARVHRGIDVMAAVLASITACSISKEVADSIDRYLQVIKRVHDDDKMSKKKT